MISDEPSYQVVEAIAQKKGVSPTELFPPLFSVVNPEALDALAQPDADSNTSPVEITFTYLDYEVRVRGGPTVSISVRDGGRSMDNSGPLSDQ